MKKILFVLPFFPYPLDNGGAQAMFNGIKAVKDKYIIHITFRQDWGLQKNVIDEFIKELDCEIVLHTFIRKDKTGKTQSRKSLISKVINKAIKIIKTKISYKNNQIVEPLNPYKSWFKDFLFSDTSFIEFVKGIIEQQGIDVVQCEMLETVAIGFSLPKNLRKIFVHHELGWIVHGLGRSKEENRFVHDYYVNLYKNIEVALLNKFDDIIVLSSVDKDKLIKAGVTKPIHTSFAVVNTKKDLLLSTKCNKVLSFVGPEINPPNFQGLKWFISNVWGNLYKEDSSYHLKVIGRWSEKTILTLRGEYANIEFLGFVDNLADVLKDTIMIVPITIGSGIRMKILEAASLGVPFVTTSVGVEGIPVVNGEHCFVADTPDAFLNSILKLQDQNLRNRFAKNANSLISSQYNMDLFKDNRLSIYNS